jgi:hypothetical protein
VAVELLVDQLTYDPKVLGFKSSLWEKIAENKKVFNHTKQELFSLSFTSTLA